MNTATQRIKAALLAAAVLATAGCGSGGYGSVSLAKAPKVVNVSSYDPKERQRPGDSFSESDVSALRRNGALALIARCGKGGAPDAKCGSFVRAAERSGMLAGTYYFVTKGASPQRQADHYINLLQQQFRGHRVLLAGDFDTRSKASDLVAFINRIEARTGVRPLVYLENGAGLRAELSHAPRALKRRIRQCPYWLALYSHTSGFRTPRDLMRAYGVWNDWALWQYAGVEWKGRSVARHYRAGPWRSPAYFGTMDRPLEHNAFNGSARELDAFWQRHSWQVR